MVDPEELRTLAQMLGMRADAVASLRDRLRIRTAQATWSGGAAVRLQVSADLLDRRIAEHAEDVTRLGMVVRRLAEELSEQLAELRSIEEQVRAWLATNPTQVPPWPPTSLPLPGVPEWRDVQRAFSQAGIDIQTRGAAASTSGPPLSAQPTGI